MSKIIGRDFYERDPLTVARELIGKVLVRRLGNVNLTGIITETEAYSGAIDKACHAYGGRKTTRTQVMYGGPGFSYVYFIYGLYHCLNIVTSPVNVADAVLIRAVSPLAFNRDGKIIDLEVSNVLAKNRYKKEFSQLTKQQIKNFCNGPSKLCMAFDINKSQNGLDLCTKQELWLEESSFRPNPSCIMNTKRIGIDYAEEAKDFLWRYVYEGEVSIE